MIEAILENLSSVIEAHSAIAPAAALLAGALTSILPCSLSSLPLVILYVSGGAKDKKSAFKYSLAYAIGASITFIIIGLAVSSIGGRLSQAGSWYYIVLAVLMVLLSLDMFGVIHIMPSTNLISKNKKRGFAGAFIAGILSSVFSSPCSTPVLIALMLMLTLDGTIAYSLFLLVLYSIGYSILSIAVGSALGIIKEIKKGALPRIANILLGVLILLLALYLFYLGF